MTATLIRTAHLKPSFRTLGRDNKPHLAITLLNAGVKARIRFVDRGFRVCFAGPQTTVIEALDAEGFRAAGGTPFHAGSFNQPHEVFVRLLAT